MAIDSIDDFPRLSDDDREAVTAGGIAMQGVPVGEEPADDLHLHVLIDLWPRLTEGARERLLGLAFADACPLADERDRRDVAALEGNSDGSVLVETVSGEWFLSAAGVP